MPWFCSISIFGTGYDIIDLTKPEMAWKFSCYIFFLTSSRKNWRNKWEKIAIILRWKLGFMASCEMLLFIDKSQKSPLGKCVILCKNTSESH